MNDRYVKTAAIKSAVSGHELEVLRAVNIDWNSARGHIKCPYPDHGGEADWRWDDRTARAYCTCVGKRSGEKRTHTIFDVVATAGGIDFEAAKIRVAEIIGRSDLIGTKRSDAHNGTPQRTDAESLLSPRAENRDDDLVWAYLGYRLGIVPDQVPRPTTRVAGLRQLGYFDPPSRKGGKPLLVTTAPAAVFETIDRDGRRHAHRIYLEANGAGKADLGLGPDGRARDAKKSAKRTGNSGTSGLAVLWGDPEKAMLEIIAEGVENAAAVALGFQREIDDGEVIVASCISAGGVEAFKPWTAARSVTVAADRDEAPKPNGRPGSRRGEQAARKFCIRINGGLATAIALPGAPGDAADWLDILRREGLEAVRAGILAAEPFEATPAELATEETRQVHADEIGEVSRLYPLPALDTVKVKYHHTPSGKVKVHKIVDNKDDPDGEPHLIPITTPFGAAARLRHVDQADAYGLRVRVQDMSGKPRDLDIDRAALGRMAAAEIRSMLFGAGLRTEGDGEHLAVQCLKAADPEREIVVVGRPGWHVIAGYPDPIFIAPDGEIIGAPEGLDLELSAAARMDSDVAKAGTMDGWRAAVEAALSEPNCQHWTLGVLAGFAGPLVALTGLNTCGINFSGGSSLGKSTGQQLAVSAWSTPDIRRAGLFETARATDNAVEALAQRGTGLVLALDELAHIPGKAAGKLIYMIAGGKGKRRLGADTGIRDSFTWATFAILSCECSLAEKVRGDGGEWVAGMAVRITDIDVSEVNRAVEAATLRRISGIEHHYGYAGPAFARALVECGAHRNALALRDQVTVAAKAIVGGDATDGPTLRAATPLALLVIAGELAKSFGLIPPETRVREAVEWAWSHFRQSSDAEVLDPETQAISSLRAWIAERWGVTIKNADNESGVNNRETVAWFDDKAIYIPRSRIREASGGGVKEAHIGALLDRRGLLATKPDSDRFVIQWVPKVGKIAAYALRREEFGRSVHVADPDKFKVYPGGRDD